MSKQPPTTSAMRVLDQARVAYELAPYDYVERGGTGASSAALGVDEHHVVKTLVFEDANRKPLLVLMHGDREVSAKALARHLGSKEAQPCAPATAERHTGYKVGGISPFGTRRALPVYVEASILELARIWINGGRRGLLVVIDPRVLVDVLGAQPVSVAREG